MRTVTLIPHLEKTAQELAVTDRPQPASLDARREDYQPSDDRSSERGRVPPRRYRPRRSSRGLISADSSLSSATGLRTMRRRLGMPLLLVESSLDPPEICGLSNVLALLDDDVAEHAAYGDFGPPRIGGSVKVVRG